ncbi:MAG TPA: glycoside hydrolase family 3 C-terminal domain-containing protein [Acidobacteriaceae bacterium]|nr:glycoside hydrolase family 3 C-terminal domain-containing protein [Acidobacteriaceae bacterium]
MTETDFAAYFASKENAVMTCRALSSRLTASHWTALLGFLTLSVFGANAQTPVKSAAGGNAPYRNASLPLAERAHDLVAHMTLAEKVSQMQNHAAAIPRLGIPEYDWWSEGLHGVARSGYATVFPQAIGMAATWDAPLIYEEANVIGMEGRGRYNSAVRAGNHAIFFGMDFWSPNVNIFRDPRWGRGQETYGEDPFLTGQLGVQFVHGLQGSDPDRFLAIATPKHFDVHSGPESERHRFNVNVSPHDLQDTYLPAFRATVVDGHADSVMCAYNAVDGAPACANQMLLEKILRGDWQFHGYVVSDCGAISDIAEGHKYAASVELASVAAVRAGTDLSCGKEYSTLVQAVHEGLIKESEIDNAVQRLMLARFRLGLLDLPQKKAFQTLDQSIVNSPLHVGLNLRAAEESMVLLKNDGVLPLRSGIKTIAVIGPNSTSIAALEGNYNGTPIQPITPLSAFHSLQKHQHIHILDAQGTPYVQELSLSVPPSVFHRSRTSHSEGLTEELFPKTDFSGHAVKATSPNIEADWNAASPAATIPSQAFSVRWTGTFTPPAPGDYPFQVQVLDCYPCDNHETYAVWFDGKKVASGSSRNDQGRTSPLFTVHFTDTQPHSFRMEYSHQSPLFGAGISLNWKAPANILRDQAVSIAKQSDIVVAFVGISPRLEGEEMPVHIPGFSGGDRTSIDLPEVQDQMLQAVAATGKPLIVVLMNGSALAVNWAQQHANAILEAWYPGARGGKAIVDTILGKNNPGGRLPVTFYRSTAQLPAFEDYSMANRTYRYFRGKPLYAYGYGLSYSSFSLTHFKLSSSELQAGQPITAEADVTNTSKRAGDEVAELYVTYPASPTAPIHALAGFSRIHIAPGATQHVTFLVNSRSLSQVLPEGKRVILPGTYTLSLGEGQPGTGAEQVSSSFQMDGQKTLAP